MQAESTLIAPEEAPQRVPNRVLLNEILAVACIWGLSMRRAMLQNPLGSYELLAGKAFESHREAQQEVFESSCLA